MIVIIGGVVYTTKDGPLMIVLDDEDREALRDFPDDARIYAAFPFEKGMDHQEEAQRNEAFLATTRAMVSEMLDVPDRKFTQLRVNGEWVNVTPKEEPTNA